MAIISKENPYDMGAECFRAMAEARLDQVAAEVAVHAVVGPSGDVAGIPIGIDLHVDVAALLVLRALQCGEEREIALYDHADGLFGVAAQFDDSAGLGPDDFEHRAVLCMGRCE